MTAASIEVSIPEGVSARIALEWAVQRLIKMIDYLDELEAYDRDHGPLPADCLLTVKASSTEILHAAFGEEAIDVE